MGELWRVLATHAISRFASSGVVALENDDTLYKKSGRKVAGAGIFRDAVRSTAHRVAYALGLNLVVVTLRVTPPWGGCPIGVPVNVRLRRKGDETTTVEHAAAMSSASSLAGCPTDSSTSAPTAPTPHSPVPGFPDATSPPGMRRDAVLYQPAPPKTGKRGRPRTKEARLPIPQVLAAKARLLSATGSGSASTCERRDRRAARPRFTTCCGTRSTSTASFASSSFEIPKASSPTTSSSPPTSPPPVPRSPPATLGVCSIEVTYRDAKQDLHGEDPQCWKRQGPERAAACSRCGSTASSGAGTSMPIPPVGHG